MLLLLAPTAGFDVARADSVVAGSIHQAPLPTGRETPDGTLPVRAAPPRPARMPSDRSTVGIASRKAPSSPGAPSVEKTDDGRRVQVCSADGDAETSDESDEDIAPVQEHQADGRTLTKGTRSDCHPARDDQHGGPLNQSVSRVASGRTGDQRSSRADELRLRTPTSTAREPHATPTPSPDQWVTLKTLSRAP